MPLWPLRRLKAPAVLAAALTLSACVATTPQAPDTPPQTRPEALVAPTVTAPAPPSGAEPSRTSQALAIYYEKLEAQLVMQGLLRTDGGGPDTPYTDTDLIRNFEAIALHDEYQSGAGLRASDGASTGLRKWVSPVRFNVEFGASVPEEQRQIDRGEVSRYAARLARVTGHPISASSGGNFHVLFMGEDDRTQAVNRIQTLVPYISPASLDLFRDLPRSIHCLVVAFSASPTSSTYTTAVALIRAEHPSLMRKSCIHEELAQGLGLANDSPRARPSIFNDDDEFALLTTMDETLLELLYNPRLRPGMRVDEVRPILRDILSVQMAGGSL